MRSTYLPPRQQGHLSASNANRDIQQKLTYQQLMNLNHDLTRQNNQLKKITDRLGEELRNLHTQFEIKPRDENHDLYHVIGNHPVLHNYQMTLIPLLDCYEEKIQRFQHDFQSINEEFIMLEKKFEEAVQQNKSLKLQLTNKIKENIQLYKNGSSDQLKSDFGQLIMQQVNQKQKILLQENSKLQYEYQKYKSESEKYKRELLQIKTNYDQSKNKVKELELKNRTTEGELKVSKQNCFNIQLNSNQLQSEKNKLEQTLQRAQGQINQLIKQRDFYLKKHEDYRKKLQNDTNISRNNYEQDKDKIIQNLRRDIAFLQAQKNPLNDQLKKQTKLSKDNENLMKQNSRLQQTIDQITMKKNQLSEEIQNLNQKINKLQNQKTELIISQTKLKKNNENLNNKVKSEIQYFKKTQLQARQTLQEEMMAKIQQKEKIIEELEEQLERLQLEKDKLQKENMINSGKNSKFSGKQSKDSDKLLQKMAQKMAINKDIFDEQIQMFRNQNDNLRRQTDSFKSQTKQYKQQIMRLRQEYEITKSNLLKVTEDKNNLMSNIKRVRDQYEGDLKDKERQFHQRIQEIKKVVEESDRKRKLQKEKVQQISRKYQTAVEQLRRMYQDNGSFVVQKNDSRVDRSNKIIY